MNNASILLTNDDGIDSPGIRAAAQALFPLGKLVVAAPRTQQTSMGRAYTGPKDARFVPVSIEVEGTPVTAYACDASPAAVVRHAALVLPAFAPSLVVAGINYGENIGSGVTGSGTVGAALDAAGRGIAALAVSLETDIASHRSYTEQDWSAAIHFTRLFASAILQSGLPNGVDILKVEVPAGATEKTPWRMTRLSPTSYYQRRIENPTIESCLGDIVVSKSICLGEPANTDAYAIQTSKVVAVTPLSLDLTARVPLDIVGAWFRNI